MRVEQLHMFVRASIFMVAATANAFPALAGGSTWLDCDGAVTLLKGGQTIPLHRTFTFNEGTHSVVSVGSSSAADFNEVAVTWDEDNPNETMHYSVNRSTLKMNLEMRQNGKMIGLGTADCRKTQPPADNQF
jgi:hypothetical protein